MDDLLNDNLCAGTIKNNLLSATHIQYISLLSFDEKAWLLSIKGQHTEADSRLNEDFCIIYILFSQQTKDLEEKSCISM